MEIGKKHFFEQKFWSTILLDQLQNSTQVSTENENTGPLTSHIDSYINI